MRKMMAVMSLAFVLVLMVGCAKPPQDSINAANSALDAAKPMATEYAPSSLQAAEDAQAALNAELKAQEAKFALFRSYKKVDELTADLKTKADKAAADAASGKEQAKNEATTAINDATTAVADAKSLLEKAPKGKGTAADLEQMKADLTAADSTLADANTAMTSEKFKDAKAKAEAAKTSAANVTSQVQAAMEAKKTAGGAKAPAKAPAKKKK